ncbi:UNVERIFIED_CONTAM: hypothetical protein Slati_2735700 [Sesamum latifolium]|uniref:CID domain-containing protein n=1 Tax=Sesamum latifolium TaxID=2727402 RepID=A0AAW2VWH1_9LAMI
MLHHKEADQIITTWDKHLRCPEVVQRVPLLFLANDILRSSKATANEFIARFWKILPSALKEVVENGKADERTTVFRLIRIWEREKVFGSLSQSLEDSLLGEGSPPPLDLGRKCSRSITITKRDEQSIRMKLSIGGSAEKIVSAFELVLHEDANEDKEMHKCKSAVHRVEKMEKDVGKALKKAKGSSRRTITKRLKEEEENLEKSIDKLRSFEAKRAALVFQLQDALREHESQLENLRKEIQAVKLSLSLPQNRIVKQSRSRPSSPKSVAKSQAAETANMKQVVEAKGSAALTFCNAKQANKSVSEMAAELADKLVASSSSQEIMTSVLAKFVAEHAKSTGRMTSSFCNDPMLKSERHNQFYIPPQPTIHRLSSAQAQNQSITNPAPLQYVKPSGGFVSFHDYGLYRPSLPGPPPGAPPSYMVSLLGPPPHQPMPLTMQHGFTAGYQPRRPFSSNM